MKRLTSTRSAILAIASALLSPHIAAAQDAWSQVEILGGTATFEAPTNVPAINVRGKSTAVDARGSVRENSEGLTLESVEATLPVNSLATGMGVRDEHMRKMVFTNPDGTVPNVTFVSRDATCTSDRTKRRSACTVHGDLAIRGIARPIAITLTVSRAGAGFRAEGDGVLRLSAYGIEQPSQFGVRVRDEVKLHLTFIARPATVGMARLTARR